jgi:hypothetical protein
MKICTTCKVEKPLSEFGKHKCRADGLRGTCKACTAAIDRAGYLRHQEKRQEAARKRTAEWRKRPGNDERNRQAALKWYHNNPINSEHAKRRALINRTENSERKKAADKAWRAGNRGRCNALIKKYKIRKRQAMPVWANEFFIEEIYDLAAVRSKVTGFEWHVDHIVPLQSKVVCGLHVEHNLRVIPKGMNLAKGNRHWPDMP